MIVDNMFNINNWLCESIKIFYWNDQSVKLVHSTKYDDRFIAQFNFTVNYSSGTINFVGGITTHHI